MHKKYTEIQCNIYIETGVIQLYNEKYTGGDKSASSVQDQRTASIKGKWV